MERDTGVHVFLQNINPKVNVIARLEFELAYCEAKVQHISHYPRRTFLQVGANDFQRLIYISKTGQTQTQKWSSFVDSNTRTHQCYPTNKSLHPSARCWLWVRSKESNWAMVDWDVRWDRVKGTRCYQYDLMMMMMIFCNVYHWLFASGYLNRNFFDSYESVRCDFRFKR